MLGTRSSPLLGSQFMAPEARRLLKSASIASFSAATVSGSRPMSDRMVRSRCSPSAPRPSASYLTREAIGGIQKLTQWHSKRPSATRHIHLEDAGEPLALPVGARRQRRAASGGAASVG